MLLLTIQSYVSGYACYAGLSCYKVYSALPGSYAEAQTQCVADGGHTVIINTAAELAKIVTLIPVGGNPIWIGLTDVVLEGTFVTSLGKTATIYLILSFSLSLSLSLSHTHTHMCSLCRRSTTINCICGLGFRSARQHQQ